jgi:hypothetical protein
MTASFGKWANHGTKAWYQIMGCLGVISSEQKGTKSRYRMTENDGAKQTLIFRGFVVLAAIDSTYAATRFPRGASKLPYRF